ncbi:MAG: DinB family protein [Terriglobales bacterium]
MPQTTPGFTSQARSRERLLRQLEAAWRDFQSSYAGRTGRTLLRPGVTGRWSVRDIIAHVTTWEEECLKHLPVVLAGGRQPRYADLYGGIDAFNALTTARHAALSLPQVLARQRRVHRRLLRYIAAAPDAAVAEPRFRRRLRLDTYGHYPVHAAAMRAHFAALRPRAGN